MKVAIHLQIGLIPMYRKLRTSIFQKNVDVVETIVNHYNMTGKKIRVIGSGLSPNGICFGESVIFLFSLYSTSINEKLLPSTIDD